MYEPEHVRSAPSTQDREAGAPRADIPRPGTPRTDAPRPGTPRTDAPRAGTPRTDAPRAGTPRAGAPGIGGRYGRSFRDAPDTGPDGEGDREGGREERARRYTQISDRNRCRFCRDKATRIDYKDVLTLQKLCTNQGRLFSRKRSGNCAAHQRMVKTAIKQARYVGLLSYTV
jgi:small subunit ribosomal protein S18